MRVDEPLITVILFYSFLNGNNLSDLIHEVVFISSEFQQLESIEMFLKNPKCKTDYKENGLFKSINLSLTELCLKTNSTLYSLNKSGISVNRTQGVYYMLQ